MGNINKARRRSGYTYNRDDAPQFTTEEKRMLRASWEKLAPKTDELCIEIFLKIFEIRPDVKRFFPFHNAVGDALIKHPYFKGHALRFINAIKMAILNIDAWELILIPNLVKLGTHHARIPGFSHDIFELFYLAMNEVWSKYLGMSYKTKTKKTWCQVFKFIVCKVEEGYREGMALKEQASRIAQVQQTDGTDRKEGQKLEGQKVVENGHTHSHEAAATTSNNFV